MSEQYQKSVEWISSLMEETMADLRNTFIENQYSEEIIEDAIAKLQQQYVNPGIRVRVVPAPAKKKTNVKKESETLKWITHPGDDNFSYTEDFNLINGIPLRKNKTFVIIGAINNDGVQELMTQDIATCARYGCKAQITKIDF